MRILHIIASVNPAGGGPIEGIKRQNEACGGVEGSIKREVLSLDTPDSPFLVDFPMPVHAAGREPGENRTPWGKVLNRHGWSPDFEGWLSKNIARFDTAIVHGLWNYAAFGASRVLPRRDVPYFVFPHGMMDPWFQRQYPIKHQAKTISWLLGEGPLLSKAKSVFFTSEEEKRQASGQFPFFKYNGSVVGYGASAPPPRETLKAEAFRQHAPQLGGKPYILFLSRIHEKKGCDILIEAFAKIAHRDDSIDLVIAGPDHSDLSPRLQGQARKLGVADRIHWPGPLYGESKWAAISGADAFILPSHQENFGIAVAEALGCGAAVLISNRVNIWREIELAGAGLVADDDVDGVVELLSRWIAIAPDKKAEMRKAAKALFDQQFNVSSTGPALIERIKQAIATPN